MSKPIQELFSKPEGASFPYTCLGGYIADKSDELKYHYLVDNILNSIDSDWWKFDKKIEKTLKELSIANQFAVCRCLLYRVHREGTDVYDSYHFNTASALVFDNNKAEDLPEEEIIAFLEVLNKVRRKDWISNELHMVEQIYQIHQEKGLGLVLQSEIAKLYRFYTKEGIDYRSRPTVLTGIMLGKYNPTLAMAEEMSVSFFYKRRARKSNLGSLSALSSRYLSPTTSPSGQPF